MCLLIWPLLAAAGQVSAPPASPERAALDRNTRSQPDARHQADARVAAAASLRTLETATADAANTTAALARRRAEAQAHLDARAAALAPLLPLIERMSLYPAETLLVLRSNSQSALTGLLVLKGLARQLEADAEALRGEQAEIAKLDQGLAVEDGRLNAAQAAQAEQAAGLDRQIAEWHSQSHDTEDAASLAARRAASQAGQAETLKAALTQLDLSRRQEEASARADAATAERQRQEAAAAAARQREATLSQPSGPGLGDARGQIAAPVAGNVTRVFGEPSDAGPATGLSYGPPPAARVIAPCTGRVVFAGPFRSFGQLMIIDCGGGYHFVLAGMDRLDAPVGHAVQAGEPVGVMPAWDPHAPSTRASLYLELRENGVAINPAPYLRSTRDGSRP